MTFILGEKIRQLRKERGLTQERLAEVVGVTVGAVSKWESGMSNPDISLLPELADFFEVSTDVLLGYEITAKTAAQWVQRIKELRLKKEFEEGRKAADKALARFPNNFTIVYESARLLQVAGIERNDRGLLSRSRELYGKACLLISQNQDNTLSELQLQIEIGQVSLAMGEMEQALEQLKKYNFCGLNNGSIGNILVVQEKYREAKTCLSEEFLNCVAKLMVTGMGFCRCYRGLGERKKAREIVEWELSLLDGLEVPGKASYLERVRTLFLYHLSCLESAEGNKEAAKRSLRKARECALRFDENPEYDPHSIKFYEGRHHLMGDDMGETVYDSLKESVYEKEGVKLGMPELWEELSDEEAH